MEKGQLPFQWPELNVNLISLNIRYLILSPSNERNTHGDKSEFTFSGFLLWFLIPPSYWIRVLLRLEQGGWWTEDPADYFTWLQLALGCLCRIQLNLIAWAGPRPLTELQQDVSFYRSFWNILCSDVNLFTVLKWRVLSLEINIHIFRFTHHLVITQYLSLLRWKRV